MATEPNEREREMGEDLKSQSSALSPGPHLSIIRTGAPNIVPGHCFNLHSTRS